MADQFRQFADAVQVGLRILRINNTHVIGLLGIRTVPYYGDGGVHVEPL